MFIPQEGNVADRKIKFDSRPLIARLFILTNTHKKKIADNNNIVTKLHTLSSQSLDVDLRNP